VLLNDGTELAFRVREDPRTRRVRIVVSRRDGMVVTIPRGFDRGRIPEVLGQKRDWIERALRRFPVKPEPYRPRNGLRCGQSAKSGRSSTRPDPPGA